MTSELLTTRTGQVAVVTLHRPDSRNALSRALLRELYATIAELDADEGVAAILLTGTDPAFCAGVDLTELLEIPGAGREVGPRSSPMFRAWTPVIGAINGAAYTGGFELALNCDWLLASERARFADTHAKFGFTPGWGLTVLLPQAIGARRARQLMLSGEVLDAQRALDWGLVNEVLPHNELMPRAIELAAQIAEQGRAATQTLTRLFHDQDEATSAELWQLEHDAWIDPDTATA